ncbi:hypothetical protein BURK2_01246 [Burkholderiales bacterium]|nr:hypothetical protein BURK2_01246 [Burkholderiales bacterium]
MMKICRLSFLSYALIALVVMLQGHSVQAAPLLDTGFGAAGTARIGTPWSLEDDPGAAAMQPDGKLLVAGQRRLNSGRVEAYVLRLDSNGVPDPSFGADGVAVLTPPSGFNLSTGIRDGSAQVEALASGGALVRGWRGVTRLTAQGAVDLTFGTNGYYVSDVDLVTVLPQADGKTLLLSMPDSNAYPPVNFPPSLTRLTAQGQLDQSFGTGGTKVVTGLPPNFTYTYNQGFVARPDGGLYLFAQASFVGGTFLIIAITPEGVLDASFGQGGFVSGYDLGYPSERPEAAALTPEGGLWLYRYAGSESDAALFRLHPNGSLDTRFGQGGRLALGSCCKPGLPVLMRAYQGGVAMVEQYLRPGSASSGTAGSRGYLFDGSGNLLRRLPASAGAVLAVSGYEQLYALGLFESPTGGLLVPAEADTALSCRITYCVAHGQDLAVMALDPASHWQQGYGRGDGVALWGTPGWSQDWIDTLRVEPDGKILAAGFTFRAIQEFLVTRLDAAGALDSAFGAAGRYVPDPYLLAHFTGKARLSRAADGRLAIAAGTAYGSFGSVASVSAIRLSNTGAFSGGFAPSLTAPDFANADVALATATSGRVYYSQGDILEARLADGSPDLSFGTGGKVNVPVTYPYHRYVDLVPLGDGAVALAAGEAEGPRIYKFDAAGAPVTSFGENGVFRYAKPVSDSYGSARSSIFALPNGGLLLAYAGRFVTATPPNTTEENQLLILRISSDGRLLDAKTLTGSNRWALIPLPDGSLAITKDQALYRMFADGSLDMSFGPGGAFALPMTRVDALAVDGAGRLLIAGQDDISALLQRYQLDAHVSSLPVVEFYNVNLNHYFVTGGAGEIAAIEAGAAGPGWSRTGLSFNAFGPESGVPIGALPVCRFYGTPGVGPNSHFYTVDSTECENVKRDPGWTYEGTALFIYPPNEGACAAGQVPVYRNYNMRFAQNDSNHRYTTDTAVYAQMQAQGWAGEGVAFCAPQ